jgi:translation initiation factor IF-3
LEEIAKVESLPVLEGKRMSVILAPKKPGQPKKAQKPVESKNSTKEVTPVQTEVENTEDKE